MLIAEKGAVLPKLCLYSGQPTQGRRVTKTLAWAPPAIAILIVVSVLIYIVVYFIVRKTGTLQYSLSEEARSRRTSGIVIALGGLVVSIVLFVLAAERESAPALIAAITLMLGALIVGLLRSRVIHIAKIDRDHIHLRLRPETAQAFAATLES